MKNNLKNIALKACNDEINLFTGLREKLKSLETNDDVEITILIQDYFKNNFELTRNFSKMVAFIRRICGWTEVK